MTRHTNVGLSIISAVMLAFEILVYPDLREHIVEPFYYPTFIASILFLIGAGIMPWVRYGRKDKTKQRNDI